MWEKRLKAAETKINKPVEKNTACTPKKEKIIVN
jgi:hypothetical protein